MRLSVFLLGLFATSTFSLVIPQRKYYTGHSVWKVHVGTHDQAKAIRNLGLSYGLNLDFWRDVKRVPSSADIRVSPIDKPILKKFLDSQGIPFQVKIEDVDSLIQEELGRLSKRKIFQAGEHPSKITLDQYHNYAEIMAYLDATVSQYPTTVSKFSIGNSFEKRAQAGVKIGNPTGNNKPAVFVEGTIHSSEWLATSTMLYIIDQLTTNATSYKSLLDAIDVYVLPVVNPDGYVYTWTTDRIWSKSRSGPRQSCYGVNLHRNFNFKWMVADVCTDPCSNEYDGPSPASEIEVQNLQNFWGSNNKTIKCVFDIHADGSRRSKMCFFGK